MNNDWYLLDWDYVCDQSEDIRAKHEQASFDAEYGVDWNEFIIDYESLWPLAQKWWNKLPKARKVQLLERRLAQLQAMAKNCSRALGGYEV